MFRGFRGRGRGRHGASRQNLGLVLLALQIFQFGVDRIPLVTLITLITNIGVYLHVPELFAIPLPKVQDICISYQGVVVHKEYSRLFLSGFYHLTDMHLYYNMASLLYKGTQIEPRVGSARFASLIGVLLVGSSAVYCALQYCAALLLGPLHFHTCAAGFSAVLFGLKVLLQNDSPPSHRLFGIPIHMAYWSELIWISIISPNASFVGHLAGIIAGLLITHGPLNFVMSGDMPSFPSFGGRARRSWGSGVSGGGSDRGSSTPDHRGSATDHVNSYYGATPRESRGVPPQQEDYHQNSQEEAEIQEAIRRSLQGETPDTGPAGYETGPAGYETGPAGYETGPAGYETGPAGYDTGYNRLYPDIPIEPSAPPPTNEVPASNSHNPAFAPNLPLDVNEMRRRRVQRFQ